MALRYRSRDKRRTDTPQDREAFARVRRAERQYAAKLRKVARHVGDIIREHDAFADGGMAEIKRVLDKYAEVITPWAKAAAARMIADVGRRDEKAWEANSRAIGRSLRGEVLEAPTGQFLRERQAENVKLITSLPTEAAERVQSLTLEALFNSSRASSIATEIARSGEVTVARANMIARTEVSKTSSGLVEARARHVGSDGYIWRTAGDSDVRHSHRQMNGKFVRWDEPPTLDKMTGHAGSFPNCRCYPEPVIPEDF